jgi:hypothetical protein
MKKFYFIFSLFTLICSCVSAQELEAFIPRTGIGFVPQYTISGGLRFDIDRSISKTSSQWLIISPQVYVFSGTKYDHDFKELTGAGLDVKHKIYFKPNSLKPLGFYAEYGVMFQYFSITENRQYTDSYTENGVDYYEVVEGEVHSDLYKTGANFHMGYQWLVSDKVYFDVYAGAGIRISHNSNLDGLDTWYNNYWTDYGYSGTLLDGGFRVGFYF